MGHPLLILLLYCLRREQIIALREHFILRLLSLRHASRLRGHAIESHWLSSFFLGGGFLVGLEEGLLDVGGNELVAAEGHGECEEVPVALR